jgi:hypothetical protein
MKKGVKTRKAAMTEWVGPLCSRDGRRYFWIRMSISGMTDNIKASGMLSFVFSRVAEALLERYANAKCPTANDLFSSDTAKSELHNLISL